MGITDFPNELLRNIFGNFRADLKSQPFSPDRDYKAGTVNIQNIRLTCKLFNKVSSYLLIRYLNVSLTKSSLERLEKVMHHPEISQGQRVLRLDLRYYPTSMAEDLEEFAMMCYDKMRTATRSLEEALMKLRETQAKISVSQEGSQHAAMGETMSEDGMPADVVLEAATSEDGVSEDIVLEDDVPAEVPLENIVLSPATSEFTIPGPSAGEFALGDAALEDDVLEDMLAKAQHILSSWEPFNKGFAANEFAHLNEATHALLNGHERYRSLHWEQNEMLSDGSFVQIVVAAMARGHSGGRSNLWLHIWDDEYISPYPNSPGGQRAMHLACLADLDLLVQSHMIKPSSWSHFGADGMLEAPTCLLYDLPLAMLSAGVALAGLSVEVHEPFRWMLKMSQDQLSGLREVAKTLDIFEFHLEGWDDREADPDDETREILAGFYNYVSTAMGRQSVPRLSFAVNPPNPCYELGPLLSSESWPRLELAWISGISMGIQDLKSLVDMVKPGVRLQLGSIRLTSGTWAAALDCLRSKARLGSYVEDSRGAECEEMDEEEYDSIFMPGPYRNDPDSPDGLGRATLYITSQIHKNPLCEDDEAFEANPGV